jgi:spermidine synthase
MGTAVNAMRMQLAAVGAIAMLAQVALLREVGVAFFGSELALLLGLGAWLLGTGMGALSAHGTTQATEGSVRRALVAAGLLLPAAVVLARVIRPLLGGIPGAELPLARQPVALLACVLPVAITSGLLFQWTARRYMSTGRSLASAYAIESAGGLVGGLAAALLAVSGRPNVEIALAGSVVALLTAVVTARGAWVASRWLALAVLSTEVAVVPMLPRLDARMTAWTHPHMLATRDTPYGRITVTGSGGQVVVFEDDALAYENQGTTAEALVHPAAVQRPAPRRVIVLGGAAQGLLPEVLRHGPRSVLDIELDPALVAPVASHLSGRERSALDDPRVRIAYGDPRRLLAGAGRCDLLLIGMPEPTSGRTSRYYTREFFAECAAHLAPDGVLAFRLRSSENLWTPLLMHRAADIRRALADVLPDPVMLPGASDLFLASPAPLSRTPDSACARLAARVPQARLVTPAYLRYLYTNDRFAAAERLAGSPAEPNTDLRPGCYQFSLLLGLARFDPRIAHLQPAALSGGDLARSPWTWVGVLACTALVAVLRRRTTPRRLLITAVAGAAGMAIESALLLDYQIRSGVLAAELGLMLMAFMTGLALGAPAVVSLIRSGVRPRVVGYGISALLAAIGLASAALMDAGLLGARAGTALALAATGGLVAAAFAFAARHDAPGTTVQVGPLYAADLAGGCTGAVVAGLVLIPMLGLDATAALGGIVALAIVALV